MLGRYLYLGVNGSCGYHTGSAYWGTAREYPNGNIQWYPLAPWRMIVPYTNIYKFKENWERLL